MDSGMFYVGQKFKEKEEVLIFYQEFCNIYLQPFRIRNCSKERVVFKCCHGRKRKSKCTGERPNQRYLFKGCTAQINVYKGKRTYWVVTKVDLQHNHEIGRAQYDSYGRRRKLQGFKLGPDLVGSKVKDCKITNVLRKKCDKFLTRKDIQNIRNKLFLLTSQEKEDEFKNFLIRVVEENGACSISYNTDGTLKVLFIASDMMINNLKKSQPPVLQIDVFSGFDAENYKLLGFCYYSPITAKAEFAALSFILGKTSEIIKECLVEFRKLCMNDPLSFIIKKDFILVSDIKDVFPSSMVLLGKLYTLGYIKKLLSTAFACHSVTKENIFQMFRKVMYSETEEDYDEKKIDLIVIANGVKVKDGNSEYELFNDQFNNNWDSCKEMWVHCYRRNLPLIGDSATSRIERSFSTLKNCIKATFRGGLSICESIVELINFVTKRLNKSVSVTAQEIFKIMDENPKLRTSLGNASLRLNETGLRLFHKSLVSLWTYKYVRPKYEEKVMETCKLHKTNINSCKCIYWKSYEAPCQHILLLREVLNTDLYSDDCFHKRYLHREDMNDNNTNNGDDDDEVKTLTYNEKLNKVSAISEEINELIAAHDSRKCYEYTKELQNFARLVRQGEPVLVTSLPLQDCKIKKLTKLGIT